MRSAAGVRFLATRALRIGFLAASAALLVFLPLAGRFLHVQDPLERANLIFVLAGARIERWLEAVDLYKEGWAPRIVLSPGPMDAVEGTLRARGVHYPREGELARQAVIASGVPSDAVSVLAPAVDNTAHEAAVLREALSGSGVTRIIVVTSPYHTRRTRLAFRRAFRGTGVTVSVRSTRYSESVPARWWARRADIRYVTSELQKFAVYLAGLS